MAEVGTVPQRLCSIVPDSWRIADQVSAGIAHFPALLDDSAQRALAAQCLTLGAADAGFYTPVVRGQYPMSVRMLCLGRHWNAVTYKYESTRTDIDQLPVPPLPAEFADLARTSPGARAFR